MTFRTRSFVPVPPADRPIVRRRATRLIVRHAGQVLLFADSDPGTPGAVWWITPGGGVEPGESDAAAGVRELQEETGLQVPESDLIGPIATRIVLHGYSDQVTIQDEVFYAVDVQHFELSTEGFTPEEQLTIQQSGWFPIDHLPAPEVWPMRIGELFAADGSSVLDLGVEEESSVPVLPHQRSMVDQ